LRALARLRFRFGSGHSVAFCEKFQKIIRERETER
jgi:hypothetical protein